MKFASWKSASCKFVLWKLAHWKFASPHTHVLKIYVMKGCKLEVCFTAHTCFESLCCETFVSWKFASRHTHTHILKVYVIKVCKLEVCFTAHTFCVKFASWTSASWKFELWKFAYWKFSTPLHACEVV